MGREEDRILWEHLSKEQHGWFCPKCENIFFNPEDDIEHENWHWGVNVKMKLREAI